LAEVEAKYAAGDISQEAYIEALDQINDGIYDNLNAIQELDQQMMEYYGETLAQAGEEIDKFTT
jgi:predicted ribonuclease toxin of YeeF-YezG toxin-antitoxin module